MAYRKTNIGGMLQYDAPKAKRLLLTQFRAHGCNMSKVGEHFGVNRTTVHRWVWTLDSAGLEMTAAINQLRDEAVAV